MNEILIFDRPLTEEETKKHIGKILQTPVRYHLIDCLKELKYGRMTEDQKYLDVFIEFVETKRFGHPFPSELINGIWEKEDHNGT